MGFGSSVLDAVLRQGLYIKIMWRFAFTGGNKMGSYRFFTDKELAGLRIPLPAMLDMARGVAGVPFRLTSTTGGKHAANSAHFKGLAVDIGLGHLAEGFERDTNRFLIVRGLMAAGFRRIEIAPLHIHVDQGSPPDYVAPILWLGTDS